MRITGKILAIVGLMCLICPIAASAWDEPASLGARLSAEADYKIKRGLHAFVSEELRFGGTNIFDRSYTEIGISYKVADYLKTSVSYTAIAVYESEITELDSNTLMARYWYEWRHRFTGDITGSLKAGQWRFSLRERIQATYKATELNNYQQPQTTWVLRSRLKASYKFRTVPLQPYAYIEPRILFNGAKWSSESMGPQYEDARFLGHKDVYMNRLRNSIGVEWRLSSAHSLDLYCLYDCLWNKEVDARKEGSSKGVGLKAPIHTRSGSKASIGVGYKYEF